MLELGRYFEFSGGGPQDRWAVRALHWDPPLCFDGNSSSGSRRQARPRQRWVDDFTKFAEKAFNKRIEWNNLKTDVRFWADYENEFTKDNII